MSYWEDIWKLRFSVEKYNVLFIGSKDVTIEHRLSKKEIKNVNEDCDQSGWF